MMAQEYRHELKMHTTPKGRVIPKITASGRRTSGSGVTGSPTPRSTDAKAGHNYTENMTGVSLTMDASLAGHPTPNAIPENRGGLQTCPENALKRQSSGHMLNLDDSAQLAGYPSTNTMGGGSTSRGGDRIDEPLLGGIAKLAGHPTCSARDWKDTTGMAQTGTNPDGTERIRLDQLPRMSALAGPPRVTTNSGIGNPDRACDGKSRLEDQCHGATPSSTDTSTEKTAGYRLNASFSMWLMMGRMNYVASWVLAGMLASRKMKSKKRSTDSRYPKGQPKGA